MWTELWKCWWRDRREALRWHTRPLPPKSLEPVGIPTQTKLHEPVSNERMAGAAISTGCEANPLDRLVVGGKHEWAEVLQVGPDRRLLRAGDLLTSIVVGVSGVVLVAGPNGQLVSCATPFVLDAWAADDAGLARIDATTQSEATLVVVDRDDRHRLIAASPEIDPLSYATRALVLAPGQQNQSFDDDPPGSVSEHAMPQT